MRFFARLMLLGTAVGVAALSAQQPQRSLYVAVPGSDDAGSDRAVRVLVFDIDHAHRFLRRIPLWPAALAGDPESVRGIASNARTARLYISTTRRLAAIDLTTDRIVWEHSYEDRCCDRIAVSPDGGTIYAAAFGQAKWYVVEASTGELRTTIRVTGWPRDTVYSRDGARVYLGAWDSQIITVVDAAKREVVRTVGPFSASVCPFTINATATLAFANVDGLVGFEVGDLQTGLILDSVAADGYDKEAAGNYECPSHGIAFAPNGRELWIADGVRNRLHVFDATVYPPKETRAIQLAAQPRWIAFSLDGTFAYSSTGDVIDVAAKRPVGVLRDEAGAKVVSESLLETGAR